MSDQPFPDTRKQLTQVIQALRMAAFPRVLYQFADAYSTAFVPTRAGANRTAEAVAQIRNDAALRHWLCENAELEQVTYCRMALFALADQVERADEARLGSLATRIMIRPVLFCILADALRELVEILKA